MKTLFLATITAACLAIAAPTFAAPKGDKPDKPNRQMRDGQKAERVNKLFSKIEDKLGRELTADQKQQITQATRRSMQGMKSLQQDFIQSIANAMKISTDEVKQAIKPQPGQGKNRQKGAALDPAGRITAALETHLNRKLTDEETTAITAAIDTRKAAAKPVMEEYVASLAKITGLTVDDVKGLLPKRMES